MNRNILDLVRKYRVISILRGFAPDQVPAVARALYAGGIHLLEITFAQHSPTAMADTPRAIRAVREEFGDRLAVGAGTVLTCAQAEAAAEAGATFLLSAVTDPEVIREAKSLGLGMIPGAMTPSEILRAYDSGADLVKVFPADSLGIPYLKAVRAPLSHIPMIAVGGIGAENFSDFLAAGMEGVGVGGRLADPALAKRGDLEEITRRAAQYTASC